MGRRPQPRRPQRNRKKNKTATTTAIATTLRKRRIGPKKREGRATTTPATTPVTTRTTIPQERAKRRTRLGRRKAEIKLGKAKATIPATTTTPRITAATTAVTTAVTTTTITTPATTTRITTTKSLVVVVRFAPGITMPGLALLEYPSLFSLVFSEWLGQALCFGAGRRKNSGAGSMMFTANLLSRQYTVVTPILVRSDTETKAQKAVSALLVTSDPGSKPCSVLHENLICPQNKYIFCLDYFRNFRKYIPLLNGFVKKNVIMLVVLCSLSYNENVSTIIHLHY